jgi:hypothetical protein
MIVQAMLGFIKNNKNIGERRELETLQPWRNIQT